MLRLQQHNKLARYNQMVFGAIAEHEPLQDVHTITLKGEYVRKVERMAAKNLHRVGKKFSENAIVDEMIKIFDSKTVSVREAVTRNTDGLFVVVSASTVNDEATVRVFQLVEDALDKLDGRFGTIYYGPVHTFSRSEITWLNMH